MIKRLWRKLTFKHRLKVEGPLHITFPVRGVYLISSGGKTETREIEAGETLTFIEFEHTTYLGPER